METEELIEDQQQQIRELERQAQHLKEKLLVAKQQLLGPGGGKPPKRPLAPSQPAATHRAPSRFDIRPHFCIT